jgi:hypothetical protein
LTQSEFISLAAFLVAVLAAIYARRAIAEAKRANKISLHIHKVQIYEEVLSFSDCFRGFINVPSEARLEEFRKKAVQRAEVYLSNHAHLQLLEIYDHCRENEMWLSAAESDANLTNDIPSDLEVRHNYRTVIDKLPPAIQRIKNEAMPDHV